MSDDRKHWLLHDPELLERAKREAAKYAPQFLPGEILAHNHDPIVDQGIFAFGDPGTETGHSLDTSSVDRTVAVDGDGNYAFFLRINLNQTRTTQDQNLTRTYKLQYDKDGADSWANVDGSSSNVQAVADGNITDGAATSERIGGTGTSFLAGEYDEGDGVLDSITWSNTGTTEYTEMLWSLQVIDADMADGATLDFRVIESDDTALNNTGTEDAPRLTWNAAGSTVYENTATATGLAATVSSIASILAVAASAAGVSATTVDMAVVRGISATVDGVATTTAVRNVEVLLTAQADGVSTADPGQPYRIRNVASSGTLGGTGTATVNENSVRGLGGIQADGLATTAVDVFRQAHRDTQADGVSTAVVAVTAVGPSGTVYELVAAPDGVGTATVSVLRQAHRDTQADGVSTTAVDVFRQAHRDTQADGVSTTAVDMAVIASRLATADGVSSAAVSVVVVPTRLTAQADGLATTAVDLATVRGLDTQADGQSTAVATRVKVVTLTAGADGVSTTDTGQLYRRRHIASSGTLGGTGTATVNENTVRSLGTINADGVSTATAAFDAAAGIELTASADGVSTSAATLYRVAQIDGGEAAGVSTATVSVTVVTAGTVYELVAAPDGVATTAVDLATVRALDTQADGVSTATASVSGVAVVEFTANADGVSSAAVSVAPLRIRDAQADGQSTATVATLRRAHRDAQADGVSTASVSLNRVYAFTVQADATAAVVLDLTAVVTFATAAGKYAPEHARAFKRIAAAEAASYASEHARAVRRIEDAGIVTAGTASAVDDTLLGGFSGGFSDGFSGGND